MNSSINLNDNDLEVKMDGDFDLELDDGGEGAEAIVACLGDDAAHLRLENPECEMAANMDAAARLIEQLLGQLAGLDALPSRASLVPAGWISSGMHLITQEEARLAKVAGIDVYPVFKVKEQATEWRQLTNTGQVSAGDEVRFRIGHESFTEFVNGVLHEGTDREEVVYDGSRNFYFITSMVLAGKSNHKGVEFKSNVQPVTAEPAHGGVVDVLEDCAQIAENYGPSRPLASDRPLELIRGRWEGEQAASKNIAAAIRAARVGGETGGRDGVS